MNKRSHNRKNEAGLSLVELLIVCIVIVILAGFAMMQRGGANEHFQRQNVARELKFAFERARFDSVKRRADDVTNRARVLVDSGSFTLTTYRTSDGVNFTAEDATTNFAGQNVVISGHGSSSVPGTVYFDHRGETVDSAGASISAAFNVCNAACNIVLITPTGTVNLLTGGATPLPFATPAVAPPIANAANVDLNIWVQMTPTPAP